MSGLGPRVWGLGFRAWSLGFGAVGLGLKCRKPQKLTRVERFNLEFRVHGLGFRV